MHIRTIQNNILAAREKRAVLRQQLASSQRGALTVSLNIPGYPKTNALFAACFDQIVPELKRFLLAHRVVLDAEREQFLRDEAGEFYLVSPACDIEPSDLKALCETFEETHPLGRLIDVDLMDQQGQPVSSDKLKPCFLCGQAAIVCMRERAHSYEELREAITHRIHTYLQQQRAERIARHIAALAVKATLYEIAASPKPGLVDRFDPGAHQDMDYFTFLDSTAAISGYFQELANAGCRCAEADLPNILPELRQIGLNMETAMFHATGGVNTHKGLIFLLGLAVFAVAYLLNQQGRCETQECRRVIRAVCHDLVRQEFPQAQTGGTPTHGETCFQTYGMRYGGARQEAEEGLPSVFDHGLPTLHARLAAIGTTASAAQTNDALIETLLSLMSAVDDTNILYRKDVSALWLVKQKARQVLQSESQNERTRCYTALIDFCRREKISPGGSADLLAVTLFVYFAQSTEPSRFPCLPPVIQP